MIYHLGSRDGGGGVGEPTVAVIFKSALYVIAELLGFHLAHVVISILGRGSAVTEWMDDHHHPVHVERMGLPDSFVEHGTVAELRRIAGLDKDAITKTCLREAGIDET